MKTTSRTWLILALCAAQLVLTNAVAEAAPPTAEPVVYMVRWGDTLYSIARRHGTTVWALARANNLLNRHLIYAGQWLTIPARATASAPSSGLHIVRRGDTLFSLARRYGTTVQALAQANGLRDYNVIYVGQRLVIPGAQAAPPRPAPQPATARLSSPKSRPAASAGKWIDVDLSTQTLVAYEGDRAVYSCRVSTGRAWTPTPTGRFSIQAKSLSQTMSGPGYYFRNVPHVMYFYRSYALHGTYWHNNFGQPMSHGCINLSQADAAWLYDWAGIGTLVIIKP
ncbi:MAG: LysM peptidoglycan-binding domain-containing protein [Anaerolineae bacterium]